MQVVVLKLLIILFVILLFAVCGKKGLQSLFSLALTVVVFIEFFIPLILKGYNPILVTFIAAVPILLLIIYLTEGFNAISHLTIIAIFLNFSLTSLLSWAAIALGGFTGLTSEQSATAASYGAQALNLQGLLMAGIILGTLGILTEMVVTQVATVSELEEAKTATNRRQLFEKAYTIGVAHLGSMINTLFLIYAGASLSLIIILVGGGGTLTNILRYEPFTTAIVRSIVGAIGLIIAMPTSTALAVWWLRKK